MSKELKKRKKVKKGQKGIDKFSLVLYIIFSGGKWIKVGKEHRKQKVW